MKKLYSFLLLFSSYFLYGQTNLVPNPSFEVNDTCPSMPGEINRAVSWFSASNDISNYFNSCAPYSTSASVPRNVGGYQYPATGSGYAGVYSYTSLNVSPDYETEIIGAQLITPLLMGQKYYIKFKLNCGMGSNYNTAIDKMGVRFTMIQHNTTNGTPFNNYANIYTSTIVSDTTNWTPVFGSFTADSAYTFIEAGNFFDYQHVNTQIIRNNGSSNQCFYFLDDICVSTDSTYTADWVWTGTTTDIDKYNNSELYLYPNPSPDGILYSNTTFDNQEIQVLDILGNLIRKFTISNRSVIDLTDLQNGVYFILSNNRIKQKVIINK